MAKNISPPVKAKGIVHKDIAKIAKELCETDYERLARQNAFYKKFPKPEYFVPGNWRHYIPMARQMLTMMLGNPNYPQAMKDDIHAILMLDGAINPKKMAEAPQPGFIMAQVRTPCEPI